MAVLQVMVKWLSEQRADNREENKDGTSLFGVAGTVWTSKSGQTAEGVGSRRG